MIRIRLLGQPSAEVAGAAVPGIERTPKKLAILAYLALHPAQKHVSREALLSNFWPDSPERPARHALSQTLHFIRQTFGAESLVTSGAHLLRLNPETVTVDVREFDAAVDAHDWSAATQLYRGDLLEGLTLDEPEAADWLDRERHRLRAHAALALWQHASERLGAGDAEAAAFAAQRAITCDPTREPDCLAFLRTALAEKRNTLARTIAGSFTAALARATDGDQPTPEFCAFVRELNARPAEPALELEVTSTITEPVRAKKPVVAQMRWLRRALPLMAAAIVMGVALRTILVRPAAGANDVALQFVIAPIETQTELRAIADGVVERMAERLNRSEWQVIIQRPNQAIVQPSLGYGLETSAYQTSKGSQFAYHVKDYPTGRVVTAGVLTFSLQPSVEEVATQLLSKIMTDLGRTRPVLGRLTTRERTDWNHLTHQQSLADSLRNAGAFGEADHAYRAGDSLYKSTRWSERTALMAGIQHVRLVQSFAWAKIMENDFTRSDSLFDRADQYATVLIKRFPRRFEPREARGQLRYQRALVAKPRSLKMLDDAIADLRPVTPDDASPAGLAALSGVFFLKGNYAGARTYAREAVKRDVFLQNNNEILGRLYQASFDLHDDEGARAACREINDRFPQEGMGAACRLTLMVWSESEPLDTAEARRIVREGTVNDPAGLREAMKPHLTLLMAGVLLRAGQTAQARTLANSVDPGSNKELLPIKAAVLTLLGDSTQARKLAAAYAPDGDAIRIVFEHGRMFKGLLPPHD